MPMITWQLWLARNLAKDRPLAWQKSLSNLTPGRVAQSIGGVLIAIGEPVAVDGFPGISKLVNPKDSPANPPKPRGKPPGWEKGKLRRRKNPCPFVKKRTHKPRKSQAKTDKYTEVIVV